MHKRRPETTAEETHAAQNTLRSFPELTSSNKFRLFRENFEVRVYMHKAEKGLGILHMRL